MPLDQLPGTIVTFTRDEERERYLRDYRLREPNARTDEGTQPFIDASVYADGTLTLYSDAIVIGNGVTLDNSAGAYLDVLGNAEGVTRGGALGGIGFVTVEASALGGTIFAGDEIVDSKSSLRFQCLTTNLYLPGSQCPIGGGPAGGFDVGPGTNLKAGTRMTWTIQRPGIGTQANVTAQSDGSGLSGGRDVEDDETYRNRIKLLKRERPASGNDTEYQATIEATPGISVEKAFTYPAINGAGTMGAVMTMRPAKPGASRVPNGAAIAAAIAYTTGKMPADDQLFFGTLTPQLIGLGATGTTPPQDLVLKVTWAPGAAGWFDATPWPPYYASFDPVGGNPRAVVVSGAVAPTATTFRLVTSNAVYTAVPAPQVGQSLAFYDSTDPTLAFFRRKKILTVAGAGPWDIVVDTSGASSDLTYTPVVGQRAAPWSDSLDALIAPVVAYFDALGPGEQFAAPYLDPGTRQKRSPVSPLFYPTSISNRLIKPVLDVPAVEDALVTEGVGINAAVGTPGVTSYILELGFFSAFPE